MQNQQKKAVVKNQPFLNIRDACNYTCLSMRFLREGCKTGRLPCVMSGNTYMINIPLLMDKLNTESKTCGQFML